MKNIKNFTEISFNELMDVNGGSAAWLLIGGGPALPYIITGIIETISGSN
jgi:hypothetical protein